MNTEASNDFWRGVDSVLGELLNAIAELEEKCSDTSYGRGQKVMLRKVVEMMDLDAERVEPRREK